MMYPIVFGILRHLLTIGGSALVANGLATQADAQSVVGGAVVVASMICSAISKKRK